jgi:serine/threonine protein kinase
MPERIGQQLGNYTLLQLLGQGGFADVYLAEHIYLKSQAAIKILQTRLSDSGDIDSFLHEAQTIARLSHPNIIRVLDFGTAQDIPYLVMDYAPNGTLRSRHARGTHVPLVTIQPYVRQIADALQYAHDEHIIHRDIKPENMLLGRRNEVLLSDFGIALVAQSSRYQGIQDVIGTVGYMSPEQIQGKPRPASDQYSLAIVVYEWLSGERPFQGSFTELCTQHLFAAPPPLVEKLARFSPEVEQVVMKALQKDPKQRYESIQLFAHAFEEASQYALQNAQTGLMAPNAPTSSPQAQPDYATLFFPDGPPPSTPQTNTQPPAQNQSASIRNIPEKRPTTSGNQRQFSPTSTFHSSETAANTRFENLPPTQAAPSTPSQSATPSSPRSFSPEPRILPTQAAYPLPPTRPSPTPQASFSAPNIRPQSPQQPSTPQAYNAPFSSPPPQQTYPAQSTTPHYDPHSRTGQLQSNQPIQQPPSSSRGNAFESLEQGYQPPVPARSEPRPTPTAKPRPIPSEPVSDSAEEWWGWLGAAKWKILAAILGIVLVCVAHNFHPFIPYLLDRRITILLVVPLFFGAAFGPWVGLVVGLGGLLTGNLLFNGEDGLRLPLFGTLFYPYHRILYSWWIPYVTYALAGFIPGLTMLRKRRYPSLSSVTRAMLLSLLVFAATLAFLLYSINALRAFPGIGLILLANLAIALLLLTTYSVIIRLIDPAS